MITREEADKIPQLKGKEYFFIKKIPQIKYTGLNILIQ